MTTEVDVTSIQDSYIGLSVLVAGGLGFIGSNLVRRLVDLGAYVLAVDALVPDHGGNIANLEGYQDKVQISVTDLRDVKAMRPLISGRQVIFNVAGQVSHISSMTDPIKDIELNTIASVSLLELCRELTPAAKIVYASTRQIYGRPQYLPVDEQHPLRPIDVNGINKIASEAYHALYSEIYGLRTVSLRLTNVYGPRMRIKDARQTFLGIWLRKVVEGGVFEVWGGAQQRDLLYIDDAVDALLAATAIPNASGEAYNIGGGLPLTLDELAGLLLDVAGTGRFDHREFPLEQKRIDIGDYYADDRRFRELTEWRPSIDLREGLTRSLDYYRAHLKSYL